MIASPRRGFAVATAVFALVVVGALAMGTLFAATHELRSGQDAIDQARAIMAAELGLEQKLATWDRQRNAALARGFGTTSTLSTPEGAQVIVKLTRLADELFLITADARTRSARRQVARAVRLDAEDPPLLAPLATSRAVAAGADIDGSDQPPVGWDCPAPGSPLPTVVIADTIALTRFGRFDWSQLLASANAHLTQRLISAGPRFTDEECDTSDPSNWGEPARTNGGPCTSYYPVVHAPGDLIIDRGRGQGLLLVDGDLTVQGGFEFYGAILVRGTLVGGPGGARLVGAVSVAGDGTTASKLDGILITLSRCAARKALLGAALPVPVVERSWYEAFQSQ